MQWNAEKTQLVRDLWPRHSATVIAFMIGRQFGETCTRNSVAGVSFRMGLCKTSGKVAGHLPEFNVRDGNPRPRKPTVKATVTKLKPATPAFTPGTDNIQCPCQIVDLEHYNCRWPIGDPQQPGFYFCGAITNEDSPYCPSHHKQAYVPDNRMRGAA